MRASKPVYRPPLSALLLGLLAWIIIATVGYLACVSLASGN